MDFGVLGEHGLQAVEKDVSEVGRGGVGRLMEEQVEDLFHRPIVLEVGSGGLVSVQGASQDGSFLRDGAQQGGTDAFGQRRWEESAEHVLEEGYVQLARRLPSQDGVNQDETELLNGRLVGAREAFESGEQEEELLIFGGGELLQQGREDVVGRVCCDGGC